MSDNAHRGVLPTPDTTTPCPRCGTVPATDGATLCELHDLAGCGLKPRFIELMTRVFDRRRGAT